MIGFHLPGRDWRRVSWAIQNGRHVEMGDEEIRIGAFQDQHTDGVVCFDLHRKTVEFTPHLDGHHIDRRCIDGGGRNPVIDCDGDQLEIVGHGVSPEFRQSVARDFGLGFSVGDCSGLQQRYRVPARMIRVICEGTQNPGVQ